MEPAATVAAVPSQKPKQATPVRTESAPVSSTIPQVSHAPVASAASQVSAARSVLKKPETEFLGGWWKFLLGFGLGLLLFALRFIQTWRRRKKELVKYVRHL